jgi:hypothetical protein
MTPLRSSYENPMKAEVYEEEKPTGMIGNGILPKDDFKDCDGDRVIKRMNMGRDGT